ncbi:hypothetical protein EST38_g9449 [Candolleomyces aberdarensis]|uniref:Uncharacterized protein n=1 Tax=Candolleomyces aberdarensis TaxID=2316362 RepID=A0A4Q2D9V5_9AGAR|nr:hypothetical protein EST38_g9449 [Candolleomyces aberdarensis]
MALRPGIYRIETVPPPGPPPDLAVGIDDYTPVRAFPSYKPVPPQGIREWRVARAPGYEDQYVIISPGFSPRPRAWGRAEDIPRPDEPVLLTDAIKSWDIRRSEDNTYVISVPNQPPGDTWAVTVKDGDLITRPYPVVPGIEPPCWQFIPIRID